MKNLDGAYSFYENSDYQELLDSIQHPYIVNKIILDEEEIPVDYSVLEVNNAYEELCGRKREDILGKNLLDILPQTCAEWIALCGDIALNQKEICTEYYSTTLKRFYSVRLKSQQKGIFAIIFNDVTSLKEAHLETQKKKESFESLFKNIHVGLIRTSVDEGRIIKANPACVRLFGYDDLESFMQNSAPDLYKESDDRKKHRSRLLRNGKSTHTVLQMQKADKKTLTISVSSTLHYENGIPAWIDSTIQDISKQKRAEERLEMNSIVFEHTLEAVVISDEKHKILTVNKAFSKITGYSRREVIGKEFDILWCDEGVSKKCDTIQSELEREGFWQGEVYKRHKNGNTFPAQLSVIEGEKRKGSKHYISIFSDITYRKQSEEKLYQLAHFDTLTGLCNRHAFMHKLQESLERCKRYRHRFAVFFMDLDGFKAVNDTYGHSSGDEVLVTIAARIKNVIRKSDTVARMGGDEFTLIVENFSNTKDLRALAQKIINHVSEPIKINGNIVNVTTSIGISIYPHDAPDFESMLRYADDAMYRAKELGKNNLQFFTK